MNKTLLSVPKMDCPSEEKLIRMALNGFGPVKSLSFDLGKRELTVIHEGAPDPVIRLMEPLKFGTKLVRSEGLGSSENVPDADDFETTGAPGEEGVLKALLAINAVMFLFEIGLGIYAQSTGLIADSLDMFADAAVYGVSLFAVGKALVKQRKAARLSGYLQLLLAALTLAEVARRALYGNEPLAPYMVIVSIVALAANVACLALISKHRTGGVHMQASFIFSANDVIANLGVILAGVLVYFTKSSLPDFVIGGLIALVVLRGAIKILKISRPAQA